MLLLDLLMFHDPVLSTETLAGREMIGTAGSQESTQFPFDWQVLRLINHLKSCVDRQPSCVFGLLLVVERLVCQFDLCQQLGGHC